MSKEAEEKEVVLTDKQRRFCEEYVVDWNATQAAIRAGYSEKTARSVGAENLTKPYIAEYVNECREKTAELAGVSALRNARELARMAYGNLSDLKKDWFTFEEWENLTPDEKAMIAEVETVERKFEMDDAPVIEQRIKIKLHNKKAAIDTLNKMFGYEAATKVDHTTKGESLNKPIDTSRLSLDEAEAFLTLLAKAKSKDGNKQ